MLQDLSTPTHGAYLSPPCSRPIPAVHDPLGVQFHRRELRCHGCGRDFDPVPRLTQTKAGPAKHLEPLQESRSRNTTSTLRLPVPSSIDLRFSRDSLSDGYLTCSNASNGPLRADARIQAPQKSTETPLRGSKAIITQRSQSEPDLTRLLRLLRRGTTINPSPQTLPGLSLPLTLKRRISRNSRFAVGWAPPHCSSRMILCSSTSSPRILSVARTSDSIRFSCLRQAFLATRLSGFGEGLQAG